MSVCLVFPNTKRRLVYFSSRRFCEKQFSMDLSYLHLVMMTYGCGKASEILKVIICGFSGPFADDVLVLRSRWKSLHKQLLI